MKLQVFSEARAAAREAAAHIAARVRSADRAGRSFSLALSGGRSPRAMFEALALEDLPWQRLQLFQVDERLVPADSPQRNFAAIRECLLARVTLPPDQVYPMPADAENPAVAAAEYAGTLRDVLGPGRVLDLVHLGLGPDGHTASLIPGDPAPASKAAVIVSQAYEGSRRLSLNFAVLSAARERLWLVTGSGKRDALAGLLDGDATMPAGRLERAHSIVFADHPAHPAG